MMKGYKIQIMVVIVGIAWLGLSGCTGITKPANFYLLGALSEPKATIQKETDESDLAIEIGPLTLPAYLDRPQIVTRSGDNELKLAEFNRWAEPLKGNFYRVLAENLSTLLNTVDVTIYPLRVSSPADYHIAIDVVRFDTGSDGKAVLIAYWTIFGRDERKILLKKKSIFNADSSSTDYSAIVAAQNQTLTEFSREIASEIKKLQ